MKLHEVLGRFEGVQAERDGWVAQCPHPLHGHDGHDATPSLRLAVSGLKVLVKCRVGCPTGPLLSAVGLRFSDLTLDEPPDSETPSVQPRARHAPLDFWHQVNTKFLQGLSLQEPDREALLRRGLSPERIHLARFRSLDPQPASEVLRRLHQAFGPRLFTVPGFTSSLRLPWGLSGLLIPVRDTQCRIVALKVRLRGSGPSRYRYFSTPGVSCGTPAHHPVIGKWPPLQGDLWVTEGELKAEVAAATLREQFVSVPGVSLWRRALAAVQHWRPRRVVVAFDWPDVNIKLGVRVSLEALIRALRERGVDVRVAWWATSVFKGLDDLLQQGELPEMAEPETLGLCTGDSPTPQPLPLESDPVPEFPLEFFPPAAQAYLQNISQSLPCPLDFPAVSALVVAGVSAGTTRRVEMYPGWEEYPVVYAASVGSPGVLKSPATKRPVKVVQAIQAELQEAYKLLKKDFLQQQEVWKVTQRLHRKALQAHQEHPDSVPAPGPLEPGPVKPRIHSVLLMDYTLEALTSLLQDSPRGVLLFMDELVAWVRSMDQYRGGKGSDRTFFMKTWSCEFHRVDRKSSLEDPICLRRPLVSVLGTIQPEILPDLLDPRGRDDGFGDRILYAFPHTSPGSARPTATEDSQLARAWGQAIRLLRALDHTSSSEGPEARVIRPTPDALDLWEAWHDEHASELSGEDFPEALKGPWSKFKAYSVRFALIAHLLRLAFPEADSSPEEFLLDSESVRRGLLLAEYFKSHRRRVQQLFGDTDTDRKVRNFVDWFRRHDLHQVVVRDLYRKLNGRFGVRGRESCLKLLRAVEDRGWGSLGVSLGRNSQERLIFTLGASAPAAAAEGEPT